MTGEILFGGTFDPPHRGHEVLIRAIRHALPEARVVVVPCYQPVHKSQPGVSVAHRLAMLARFAAPLHGVDICTREMDAGRPVYTWETLSWWRAERGWQRPLMFAMGGDSFGTLGRWDHWRRLPDLAHLLVLERPDYSAVSTPEVEAALSGRWVPWRNRARLLAEPAGLALRLNGTPAPWSSTGLRRSSQDWEAAIPAAVLDYIQTHQLYSE